MKPWRCVHCVMNNLMFGVLTLNTHEVHCNDLYHNDYMKKTASQMLQRRSNYTWQTWTQPDVISLAGWIRQNCLAPKTLKQFQQSTERNIVNVFFGETHDGILWLRTRLLPSMQREEKVLRQMQGDDGWDKSAGYLRAITTSKISFIFLFNITLRVYYRFFKMSYVFSFSC